MKNVTIYTKPTCPFCHAAKDLLKKKNVGFKEIYILNRDNLRSEMMKKSGGRHTVPQIFIGDAHVGGCDDLHALESKGKLDKLLAG